MPRNQKKKQTKQEKKAEKERARSFQEYPYLLDAKPKERYIFHSDYFQIDGEYATILSFFHDEGALDNFGAFWGINRIPSGLDEDVITINFEQIERMSEGWLSDHQTKAEGIASMNANEQSSAGTNTTKGVAARRQQDLVTVAMELNEGAAYLHCQYRMMVKAPTLEKLDAAIEKISRLYIDRFQTLRAAPYHGDQKKELSTLFSKNEKKNGKGFYFTSTEIAGSYNLVTHGLEDPFGEYVGYMVGDVNNSAVLFDVNNYTHHIVIANENYNQTLGRCHVADMWGSKISQDALLNNSRVVHIILDGANLDHLGPKFKNLTSRVDMNHGDINMFEMFGDTKDELAIFPSQMQKLILMAEQAYETTDSDRSIIRGSLEEVATKFYIDNRMWYDDAKHHRRKLRVVGLPHEQVPRLEMFVSYLDTEYKSLVNSSTRDEEKLHALSVLRLTFNNMLSNNGDLFNTVTSDAVDMARNGYRMIYDLSGLMLRGKGIAMAQLVNVIAFAISNLRQRDTIIFHGVELIDDAVKPYLVEQLDHLYAVGGRAVFLYNDIDNMLNDKTFCQFDKADYTIIGNMTDTTAAKYQELLGQDIPADLIRLITNKSNTLCYIRRNYDNVVFAQDLPLCLEGAHNKEFIKRYGKLT